MRGRGSSAAHRAPSRGLDRGRERRQSSTPSHEMVYSRKRENALAALVADADVRHGPGRNIRIRVRRVLGVDLPRTSCCEIEAAGGLTLIDLLESTDDVIHTRIVRRDRHDAHYTRRVLGQDVNFNDEVRPTGRRRCTIRAEVIRQSHLARRVRGRGKGVETHA